MNAPIKTADPEAMMFASLVRKVWCGRTLRVTRGERSYLIEYIPWGMGKESVRVNGGLVAQRNGRGRMSQGYRFRLDDQLAELSIAIPWWGELLPLCDLSFVRLEVAGQIVYEEGRPPRRPLDWTAAAGGFPVIQNAPARPPDN